MLRFLTVLLAWVGLSTASASVFRLELEVGGSNIAFPLGSYGFLVADTQGDGFQLLSDSSVLQGARNASVGSLLGADDVVFSINLSLQDFGTNQNGFVLSLTNFDTTTVNPNWSAGDQIALVWLQDNSSDVGDPYGFFRSNVAGDGTIGFVTPATGPDQTIINLAQGAGGTTPVAAFTANNGTIAVPEPRVILLIAFAPLLVKLLRSLRARRA